jgi:HEAT repeat protein
LIQDRLLDAMDTPDVRVALAYALDEEHRLPWSVLSEQTAAVRVALLHGYKKVEAADSAVVLSRAMQDEAAEVRAEAVRLAGYRADIGVLTRGLLGGLEDVDLSVRMLSARTLGWHEVQEAFAPVSVLLADPSAEVRVAAVRALGKIDPIQAKSMIEIQRFAEGEHPGLKRAAKRVMKP